MTYRPQRTNFHAPFLAGSTLTLAIMLFVVSGLVNAYAWAYQLAGLILAVVGVQTYVTNVQSDYVYKADENDLKVFRVTGKKSLCVCSLNYEESIGYAVSSEYYLAHKDEFPKNKLAVNYCKNIAPSEYTLYFFNFNGKVNRLKFEPDEEFTSYLNEKIKIALERTENEENDYE